jgi:WD40 repeat protein
MAEKARLIAEDERGQARRNHYVAHMQLAQAAWQDADIRRLYEILQTWFPKAGQQDLRGWEWYYLVALCRRDRLTLRHDWDFGRSAADVYCIALSPDGKRLASVSRASTVKMWDVTTGREMLSVPISNKQYVRLEHVRFTDDGRRLIAAGEYSGRVFDANTGDELGGYGRQDPTNAVDRQIARSRRHIARSRALSPDGSRLLSLTDDTTALTIRELWSGAETVTLEGLGSMIARYYFSPDGKRIACRASQGSIVAWDATTGECLFRWSHDSSGSPRIFSVPTWSPGGKCLAVNTLDKAGADNYVEHVRVFNVQTDEELFRFPTGFTQAESRGHGERWTVFWSPDGRRLAAATPDAVRVWDVTTEAQIACLSAKEDLHRPGVHFSPNGNYLLAGGIVWDIETGRQICRAPRPSHMRFERLPNRTPWVAWSPCGRWCAIGSSERTVTIWDLTTRHIAQVFRAATAAVLSMAWSSDGSLIACGTADGTIKVWDAPGQRQEAFTLHLREDGIQSLSWSPDGTWLASNNGGIVQVWEFGPGRASETVVPRGEPLEVSEEVSCQAWRSDGEGLVFTRGKSLHFWELATQQEVLLGETSGAVGWASYASDGERLALAHRRDLIAVHHIPTGKLLLTLTHPRPRSVCSGSVPLTAIALSPSGALLASASALGVISLWDAASGTAFLPLRGHLSGVRAMAFSPDGARLASADLGAPELADSAVKVWDLETGLEVHSLGEHSLVTAIAWSPDGKRLATGSRESTVKIWDGGSGDELLALRGHSNGVKSLAWSPDGMRLASGGPDGIKIWDASVGYDVKQLDIPWAKIGSVSRTMISRARLAAVLHHQGWHQEALNELRHALKLCPDHAALQNLLAWFLATCPDTRLRNSTRTVELSKKAVELAPQEGGGGTPSALPNTVPVAGKPPWSH